MNVSDSLESAVLAAKEAGRYLEKNKKRTLLSEQGRDVKLRQDIEAEKIILESLGNQYSVLTEETGEMGEIGSSEPYWVIDPLDGTYNYFRSIPICCVSIALWKGQRPLLGVVYDFNRDELFSALSDGTVLLNNEPNSSHRSTVPESAVVATGVPVNDYSGTYSEATNFDLIQIFKKQRMIGSAALSLAYTAIGRFDVYMEKEIMLWDVAAGLALVSASGGSYYMRSGKLKHSRIVIAGSKELVENLSLNLYKQES